MKKIITPPCYKKYKEYIANSLEELKIKKKFKIINSRPEMEQIYLENLDFLKEVIKKYYNQKSRTTIDNFSDLKKSDLLTNDCQDRYVIQKILVSNQIGMSKKDFSESFFSSAFRNNINISIEQRIDSIFT